MATLTIGAVAAFLIVNLAPVEVAPTPPNLFFAGMIAVCAMILPGISGSFILLIMGQYHNVLAAVSNRDFVTVGIVFAGCVVGIILFSRVLSWLLKRYYEATVAALVGFMIGSLWKILALERVRGQRCGPAGRLALSARGQSDARRRIEYRPGAAAAAGRVPGS